MVILKCKAHPDVLAALEKIEHKFQMGREVGLVMDIYALVKNKGKGIPALSRARKIAKAIDPKNMLMEQEVRKRLLVLRKFAGTAYVRALFKEKDPVEAVDRLIGTFKSVYAKVRASQCVTCQLLQQCHFGQQYQNLTSDQILQDPDFNRQAHQDCPMRPDNRLASQLVIAHAVLKFLSQKEVAAFLAANLKKNGASASQQALANNLPADMQAAEVVAENEADVGDGADPAVSGGAGCGTGREFDATFTGSNYSRTFEDLVKQISASDMAIFELARKFGTAFDNLAKEKKLLTNLPDKDERQEKMQSYNELLEMLPSQNALPAEVLDAKLDNKELLVRKYTKPDQRKQIFHIILDVSGSMSERVGANVHHFVTKANLASALSLATIRRQKVEGSMVFMRFFAGTCDRLKSAKSEQEFADVARQVGLGDFNGGSTDIQCAIKTAVKDIRENAVGIKELKKAEILLITDGQSQLDENSLKADLKGIELHTLHVQQKENAAVQNIGDPASILQRLSTTFMQVDKNALDLDKIVTTV